MKSLIILLAFSCAALAVDPQSIEGTWVQTNRPDGVLQEKSFRAGHWTVTNRETKTHDLTFWTGGAFHFENGLYHESIDFANDPAWEYLGTSSKFKLVLDGNQLTQIYTDGSGTREVYWRASAPAALPEVRLEPALLPQFTRTWIYGGPPATPYLPAQVRPEFGLALMNDGTFSWRSAKRPSVVKGGWTITANDTGDHILHLRVDVAGLGTKLIKGQVLRWRAQVAAGQLTLISLDGQEDALYQGKK